MINKDINFDDKFLVAGAGGMVGSAICRALKEKGYGNEKINCGLLWGRYPREMSIIGDRIISKFLTNNFKNEIAFNNSKSVIYYQTKIPEFKVKRFKNWYSRNYKLVKTKFVENFGFDLIL